MNRLGLAIVAVGIVTMGLSVVVPLSGTSPLPQYYVCAVSSSTGNMVVTGCSGSFFSGGSPPNYQTYYLFQVSLAGPCSSTGYAGTWSGATPLQGAPTSAEFVTTNPLPSYSATFTITNSGASVSGTITVYQGTGTSKQTGTANAPPAPCAAATTTSAQTSTTPASTTTTMSSSTTASLPQPPAPPDYPVFFVGLGLVGAGAFVTFRKKSR